MTTPHVQASALVVVTGATGFLGGAVTRRLVADGYRVRALGRNATELAALATLGAEARAVALDDADAMHAACDGAQVIVHAGALSSPWGNADAFERANVNGTRNVLSAARSAAAPNVRVVHVSSPSVYFRFADQLQVTESASQSADAPTPYIRTKRRAEQLVVEAAREGLSVIGLRPRALFGPGDTSLLPRLLRAARSGRLRVIGDGDTVADLTYIDNVVDAVLLAMQAPLVQAAPFYNITNGEPVQLWDVIGEFCAAHGTPLAAGRIPRNVAMTIARAMELASRTGLSRTEPLLTRYSVAVLSYSQTLSIDAARHDLGYEPRVKMRDAIARTLSAMSPWSSAS